MLYSKTQRPGTATGSRTGDCNHRAVRSDAHATDRRGGGCLHPPGQHRVLQRIAGSAACGGWATTVSRLTLHWKKAPTKVSSAEGHEPESAKCQKCGWQHDSRRLFRPTGILDQNHKRHCDYKDHARANLSDNSWGGRATRSVPEPEEIEASGNQPRQSQPTPTHGPRQGQIRG